MKRRNRWLATPMLVLVLLVLPSLTTAATYYVNAGSGTDAGDCSTACKTITYAAANVPAGTSGAPNVIMVAAGTYDETGNGETFPINFINDYVSLTGAGLATTTIDVDATDTWDALDVDARGFSVSGFTFENTYPTGTQNFDAIDISEGGFLISGNRFGNSSVVDYGVNFNRMDTDRNTSISFANMAITGNTFNTTVFGVVVGVNLDFDGATENLTAAFGNLTATNNTFSVTGGVGLAVSSTFAKELVNGTVTTGDFTFTGNSFTGGVQGFQFFWAATMLEDSQVTIGNTIVSNNTYTGGDNGFNFFGYFNGLEDCMVMVGNTTVSNNTFTDQLLGSMYIDYWDANSLYGSSSVVLGNLTVSDNTVTGDVATFPECNGITISDIGFWMAVFDESTVTSGSLSVTGNTVNIADTAFNLTFLQIGGLGEEYWDDTGAVTVGPSTISGNTFTSNDELGAIILYSTIGYSTYGRSKVVHGPLTFTDNTVVSEGRALYFIGAAMGYNMHDNSSLLVNPITIRDNTLTSNNDAVMDVLFAAVAREVYDDSSTVVKAMDIKNNTLTAGNGNGVNFFLDDYAYTMEDDATLTVSPITINRNTIKTTNGDGVNIEYEDYEVATYLDDNAVAILPDWIITSNTIDVTGGRDGIYFYTPDNPYENEGHSQAHYGSMLIDNNIFNPNKDGGMDHGIYLYLRNVAYDYLYGPGTATFGDITISNNTLYSIDTTAIFTWYRKVGDDFQGSPTLTMGDLEIAKNSIDTTPIGVHSSFELYTEEGAKVSIGELNVHDNKLTGITNTGIHVGYNNENNDPGTATLSVGAPTIADNTITGNSATSNGIYLRVENLSDGISFAKPTLSGNTVSGFNNGLFFEELEEATISCNTAQNNSVSGFYFNTDGTFSVTHNSLLDNFLGLQVGGGSSATLVVNAQKNWWGDVAGPVACATCNKIDAGVATVHFDPWLYSAPESQCGGFSWPMFVPATTGMGVR